MTDTYSITPDGEEDSPILFQQRRAAFLAMQGSTRNPDEAARALRISEASGIPPAIVDGNLDETEAEVRNQMTAQIVKNNKHIQDYINREPLAAKISNDDWHNLDGLSEKMRKLGPRPPGLGFDAPGSIMDAAMSGFGEGFSSMPYGSWLESEKDPDKREANKRLWTVLSQNIKGLNIAPAVVETFFKIFGGLNHAVGSGATETGIQLGMDPTNAKRMGREAQGMFEWALTRGDINLGHPGLAVSGTEKTQRRLMASTAEAQAKIAEQVKPIIAEVEKVEPWLLEGKEPPVGVSKIVDEVKAEQAEISLKTLDELLKDAQVSATRERNPEMFAKFIEQHTNARIGISAEAAEKLQGKLDFIPRLREQIELSKLDGSDIEVPLSEWLARVDPEVAKALRDDIRVRADGVTLNEVKLRGEAKEPEATPQVEPYTSGNPAVDSLRRSAKLEPVVVEAYHGTPHEFDQFSLEKIGTGEGAQSYGHGFYFAENPKVAGEYQQKLAPRLAAKTLPPDVVGALEHLDRLGFDTVADAISAIREEDRGGKNWRDVWGANQPQDAQAAAIIDKYINEVRPTPKGKLLTVKIKAPKEDFLDWDKPLDQQTPKVREALKKLGFDHVEGEKIKPEVRKTVDQAIQDAGGNTNSAIRELQLKIERLKDQPEMVERFKEAIAILQGGHHTGATILDSLTTNYINTGMQWGARQAATKALAEAGIPGIKYLDQGSRDAAELPYKEKTLKTMEAQPETEAGNKVIEGLKADIERLKNPTFNFVVFSPEHIEITHKDGKPVAPKVEAGAEAPLVRRSITPDKPSKTATPLQLELDVTRMEDRALFEKAQAIGLNKEQYVRFQKLIEQQIKEDVDAQTKAVQAEERKRQTSEWKENKAKVLEEIREGFGERPYIAVDNYFRNGELYGEKLSESAKINPEYLPPDLKALVPERFLSEKGMHPDDIANLFGYKTGREMIEEYASFRKLRDDTGLRPGKFQERLIDAEADRLMEQRYGNLEKNIIEEAKEHILSQTQLDLLHEQTLFFAEKARSELPIKQGDLKKAALEYFDGLRLDGVKSDAYLAASGRIGEKIKTAFLKEDWAEALRLQQQQYFATFLAREAKRLELEQARLDKLADRYSKAKVMGVDQEHANFIQALLKQAGFKVKLTEAEIEASIDFEHNKTLPDLVASDRSAGWAPEVSDAILAGDVKSKVEGTNKPFTVGDFRDFKDAIDSLNHIAHEINKVDVAGERMDFDIFKKEVVDNLKQLPLRKRESQGRWLYEVDSSLVRMEELIKDFDLRTELGPMFKAVIIPMMKSKATEFDMLTELSGYFKELRGGNKAWRRTLKDSIPQDLLIDPVEKIPYDLSREQLVNVMLNWGTRSSIENFSRGYASVELGRKATKEEALAFELRVKDLIDAHATKQDWDFVQAMWKPFKNWQPKADTVARQVSGVAPKWLEAEPIQTPHGVMDGGYWPIKGDRLGSDISVIEDKDFANSPFRKNYYRAATAKGHLKERTGAMTIVDINTSIEQAAGTMQQMIHDISFREAVVDVNKIFNDKQIRAAIRNHYGKEYEEQMIPWLRRVANSQTADEASLNGFNRFQRRLRINLVGHALPLNINVILSPDIGMPNPAAYARFEANRSFNRDLAMAHSKEIPHMIYNMDRDFKEQLERTVLGKGWSSFQAKAVEWGFKPMMKVSQEFRMSTFVDFFNDAKKRGLSDYEASAVADSAVRERHGASSIVDLPALMSSNETMKSLTMFYGYFNSMANWSRQIPGMVRRGEYGKAAGAFTGSTIVGAAFGAALFNKSSPEDSWFKTIAKALVLQPLSYVPMGLREAGSYFIEGYPQKTPTESLISTVGALSTEIKHLAKREPMKRPLQAVGNVVGLTTGLPMSQISKTGQFVWDVKTSRQRPRTFADWWRGIHTGKINEKMR